MSESPISHEHVGVATAVGAFLLGVFSYFKRHRKELHERIDRVAEQKADKSQVELLADRIEARIALLDEANRADHQRIYDHLLRHTAARGDDND